MSSRSARHPDRQQQGAAFRALSFPARPRPCGHTLFPFCITLPAPQVNSAQGLPCPSPSGVCFGSQRPVGSTRSTSCSQSSPCRNATRGSHRVDRSASRDTRRRGHPSPYQQYKNSDRHTLKRFTEHAAITNGQKVLGSRGACCFVFSAFYVVCFKGEDTLAAQLSDDWLAETPTHLRTAAWPWKAGAGARAPSRRPIS